MVNIPRHPRGLPGIFHDCNPKWEELQKKINDAWRSDYASTAVTDLLDIALNSEPIITSCVDRGHTGLPMYFRAQFTQLLAIRSPNIELSLRRSTSALHLYRELLLMAYLKGFERDKIALLDVVIMAEELCALYGGPRSETREMFYEYERLMRRDKSPQERGNAVLDGYYYAVDTMHTPLPKELEIAPPRW